MLYSIGPESWVVHRFAQEARRRSGEPWARWIAKVTVCRFLIRKVWCSVRHTSLDQDSLGS